LVVSKRIWHCPWSDACVGKRDGVRQMECTSSNCPYMDDIPAWFGRGDTLCIIACLGNYRKAVMNKMQPRDIDRELNYKYLRLRADDRLRLAVFFDLITPANADKIDATTYQLFLMRAKELGETEKLLDYICERVICPDCGELHDGTSLHFCMNK